MKRACVDVYACAELTGLIHFTDSWLLTSSLRVGHRLATLLDSVAVVDSRQALQSVFICILAPSLCFHTITFENSIFTTFIIMPLCTVDSGRQVPTFQFPFRVSISTFCSPSRAAHGWIMLGLRLIRESWTKDAHRKSHVPSHRVAGAAGNTAGLIALLTFLDILPIRRVRVGCGDCRLWTKA